MKFSTLHLSKLFSKRSEATNPRAGRRHNDNCTPEQTRAFDASYHEVKEISITLYAHLAGCSVGPFPDLDIDHGQVMKFFGHVGAEEGERGFGLTQLGLWRAMRTGQQPAEASLIVREKMFIGKEFLVAGGVRSIMWQEESLWYDLCFETKEFYILRALIDEAILKGELNQPGQELPEQFRNDAGFSRELAACALAYRCLSRYRDIMAPPWTRGDRSYSHPVS